MRARGRWGRTSIVHRNALEIGSIVELIFQGEWSNVELINPIRRRQGHISHHSLIKTDRLSRKPDPIVTNEGAFEGGLVHILSFAM